MTSLLTLEAVALTRMLARYHRDMRGTSADGHRRQLRQAVQTAPPSITTTLKTKVWLEVDGRFVIGDGGLHLLDAIGRHGSLLAAVREMGWSYRHAWGYLRRAEAALGTPLARPRPGKGRSRGMGLTAEGDRVLARLRAARRQIDAAVGPTGPTAGEIAARGGEQRSPTGRTRAVVRRAAARP
jgi:molybdate transport system regulatory protein